MTVDQKLANRKTAKKADRDGVYKRRGWWHFDYRDPETGKWRSRTTGKTNYNEAKTARAEFLEVLGKGRYSPSNDRLDFTVATAAFTKHRQISVSAGTQRIERERLTAIKRVLRAIASPDLKLKDFNIELVRRYQQTRMAESISPRTVNREFEVIRALLRHFNQWRIDAEYKPLPAPPAEVGRALTPEEEVRLIDTAKSRPEWLVAYHATVLEMETGMRGAEVRSLRLKAIDLSASEIRITKSKTASGVRTIALSSDASEAVRALLERACALGSMKPEHHLIPAFVTKDRARRYDPAVATKGWRTAWRKMTVKAGLKGLRGHDLRHSWVTSHAEAGTPQSVLEAQAGHLSKRMSDHYKHVSDRAAHKAAQELARVKSEQRAAARAKLDSVQSSVQSAGVNLQVIERAVSSAG